MSGEDDGRSFTFKGTGYYTGLARGAPVCPVCGQVVRYATEAYVTGGSGGAIHRNCGFDLLPDPRRNAKVPTAQEAVRLVVNNGWSPAQVARQFGVAEAEVRAILKNAAQP